MDRFCCKSRVDYDMLESGDVFDGMHIFCQGQCMCKLNYDVTTVEVNTSSDVSTDNINCDVNSVQIRNITNNDIANW